ncbi:MAG: hypothetical protein NTZ95_04490 [Candidatus Omnitrophica bacterium]|nr:hypothetical protein [Candidatus Omnitrophota bacterium]
MKIYALCTIRYTLMLAVLLTVPIGCIYAWDGNDNDKGGVFNSSSSIFSPGYINAAKQHAYEVINQQNQPKSWWDNLVDAIKNKTSKKVEEQANTKVTPEVKKKTSSSGRVNKPVAANAVNSTTGIIIDSGGSKYYENGKLTYEVIAGQKYIYACFDNFGTSTIQAAISMASAGDNVLVKSGIYNGNITLKDGVSIYGGYSNNGARNITGTPTIINGSIIGSFIDQPTEINGFTIDTINDDYCVDISFSSNITILNNALNNYKAGGADIGEFESGGIEFRNNNFTADNGIYLSTSSATILNNNMTINNYLYVLLSSDREHYSSIYDRGDYIYKCGTGVVTGNIYFASWGDWVANPNVPIASDNSIINSPDFVQTTLQSNYNTPISMDAFNTYDNRNFYDGISERNLTDNIMATTSSDNDLNSAKTASVLKDLLNNKKALIGGAAQGTDPTSLQKTMINTIDQSTLGVEGLNPQDMHMAMKLASILKNPTSDQKLILNAVESLLADIKNLEEKAGTNPELNKCENDLLQMVASVLLAQGVPDLLKEGDIEGVKGIFRDLGASKDKIMLDSSL